MATSAETLRRSNEQAGTRAKLRNLPTSPYKVRQVLDLIRGKRVARAQEILRFCDRGPATPVAKLLSSAIANAEQNDSQVADELFVSSCFADEGTSAKRMRPGSKGRAGRIRKRSSHVTIVVSRLADDELAKLETETPSREDSRARRVAGSRAARTAASKKRDAQIAEAESESDVQVDGAEAVDADKEVAKTAEEKDTKAVAPKKAKSTKKDDVKSTNSSDKEVSEKTTSDKEVSDTKKDKK